MRSLPWYSVLCDSGLYCHVAPDMSISAGHSLQTSPGPQPVNLDYRINDATSMMFSESQPAHIRMEMADNESSVKQQVTVIPQREGRFYLNVSASFETESGTHSTVIRRDDFGARKVALRARQSSRDFTQRRLGYAHPVQRIVALRIAGGAPPN